ncbi:MAG: alpha/beta fold hydrolase [Myxococcaceae bacterium]|nr:alpha/beta fold hydrolase [Myxococcaceae bacterium]
MRRGRVFPRAARRVLKLVWKPDEVYRRTTADGATIALGRYHARERRRFVQPVVLAHGLGANRFDLDFDERYSLARHLARRGFETWVLELRGRGHAGRHGRATSFDDQAEHDVEAALSAIGQRVLWVGHSKGGLAAYAHLARHPLAPIDAIVTLGSPVAFDYGRGFKAFTSLMSPLFGLPVIPLRAATRVATLTGLPPEPIGSWLVNPKNLERRVVRQAIYNVSADVFGGVAKQFARWAATGRFDGNDGFDYLKNMAAIRAPVLLIAGSEDKLATPAGVLAAQRALGGPSFVHVARGYGHGDLTVGLNAPEEVFPEVSAFLERHATVFPS